MYNNIMYLLYPTVHFHNLGSVQEIDIFLGIKILCHSLLVMLVFDFPLSQLRKVKHIL